MLENPEDISIENFSSVEEVNKAVAFYVVKLEQSEELITFLKGELAEMEIRREDNELIVDKLMEIRDTISQLDSL